MASLTDASYLLGMTYRKARAYFVGVIDALNQQGFAINLSFDLPSGAGITFDNAVSGDGHILLGASDLRFGLDNAFGYATMSDQSFVEMLVAMHHELRHAEIFCRLKSGARCPDGVLESHLASQGSNGYYTFNRYLMAHEIDAECHGVFGAYASISEMYGENVAENLVCKYVNWQCSHNTYYLNRHDGSGLGKEFLSIQDISDAFFGAYELSIDMAPINRDRFGVSLLGDCYKQFRTSWSDDVVVAPMVSNGVKRPECSAVFDSIWDAGNGAKDKMVASLTLHFLPDTRTFYGRDVCRLLSLESVFGVDVAKCVPDFSAGERTKRGSYRMPICIQSYDSELSDGISFEF